MSPGAWADALVFQRKALQIIQRLGCADHIGIFLVKSNRFASMTAGVRSATPSRTSMQRMSRMKPSVTVARTQPLALVPETMSVSMRSELKNSEIGAERRARAHLQMT